MNLSQPLSLFFSGEKEREKRAEGRGGGGKRKKERYEESLSKERYWMPWFAVWEREFGGTMLERGCSKPHASPISINPTHCSRTAWGIGVSNNLYIDTHTTNRERERERAVTGSMVYGYDHGNKHWPDFYWSPARSRNLLTKLERGVNEDVSITSLPTLPQLYTINNYQLTRDQSPQFDSRNRERKRKKRDS